MQTQPMNDAELLEWLLKHSCIKIGGFYYTQLESVEAAVKAVELGTLGKDCNERQS